MDAAYLYDGIRTPIGRFGGGLAHVRPDDLLAATLRALADRNPTAVPHVEDVITGCANQAGEDTRNVSRNAALLADFPVTIAGETVNRLCGSGLCAVINAARAVAAGDGRLVVAAGVESMTRAPLVMAKADKPWSRDMRIYDSTIGSRFPNPRNVARYGDDPMAETAENIARDLDIARSDSDRYAARSQRLYASAKAGGVVALEITPVTVSAGRNVHIVSDDEHPRPESDIEALADLRPLREGGQVTAGNASGINDGAAAALIGDASAADILGREPIARIRSLAVAGVEPRVMGLGPVTAISKALDRAGLSLDQCDVIEINEAFAVQVLGCLKQLGVAFDDSRVNPNGGAIAVGHPLGATGVRIALSAARHLQRSDGRFGVVSLCIGIGQGAAIVLERENGR